MPLWGTTSNSLHSYVGIQLPKLEIDAYCGFLLNNLGCFGSKHLLIERSVFES